MARKRGLGRGLDALLSGAPVDPAEVPAPSDLRKLPVDLVQRGRYQPRHVMDEQALTELAQSIRQRGVVQPIVVRPLDGGARFELVAGERRWRAAQLAGLDEIPAVVREFTDEEAAAVSLIENIQRENLNPIEEASGLRRLLDDFGLTHQELADAIGRSRTTVTNALRLLDLNEDVRALLESGDLDMGQARALLGLEGPVQSEAAAAVVARGLSARETEALVRRRKSGKPAAKRASDTPRDPDVRRLEGDLAERLGARVELKPGRRGRGKVVIHYASLEELDGLIERLG